MVYLDKEGSMDRICIKEDEFVKCHVKKAGETIDYGDEDCIKKVTPFLEGRITLAKQVVDMFENRKVPKLTFIRYDYYRPAYSMYHTKQELKILPDGSAEITVTSV